MTFVNRADVVRLLASANEEQQEVRARFFGYVWNRQTRHSAEEKEPAAAASSAKDRAATSRLTTDEAGERIAVPFLRAEFFEKNEQQQNEESTVKPSDVFTLDELLGDRRLSTETPPVVPRVLSKGRMQRTLHSLLGEMQPGRMIDADRLSGIISKGILPARIPCLPRRVWPRCLRVILDQTKRLTPFRDDQIAIKDWLRRRLGRKNVQVWLNRSEWPQPIPDEDIVRKSKTLQRQKMPFLLLGDAGLMETTRESTAQWQKTASQLTMSDACPKALLTLSCTPVSSLLKTWRLAAFDASKKNRFSMRHSKQVQRLLACLSHTVRIEPGLLREVRLLLPEWRDDLSLESLVWSHHRLRIRDSITFSFDFTLLVTMY